MKITVIARPVRRAYVPIHRSACACFPRAISAAWLFALAVGLAPASSAYGQLANSVWPDYGGGLANTHRAAAIGPASPQIAWTYALGSPQQGLTYAYRQPVLGSDGTIYFLTYPGGLAENVVALRPDGSRRWSITGLQSRSRVGNWPAVDAQGRLLYSQGFSGSSNSFVAARDAATGASLWIAAGLQEGFQTGPTVSANGTVYASDDRGNLKSLTSSGQANWTISAAGPFVNPAINPSGSIFCGGLSLNAVSPAGTVLWSIPTQPQPVFNRIRRFTSPAIDQNNNVYVGTITESSDPGYFLAVGAAGNQLWRREGFGGAPAIGPDGTIYAGYQGVLHAMSAADGHDLWTYQTGPLDEFGAEGVTVDQLGNIYLATTRGNLMSLTSNGQLRWDLDLAPSLSADAFLSAPVLGADGTLYVGGGSTGMFFAIHNIPEPSSFALSLLALGGLIYLARCHRWGRNGGRTGTRLVVDHQWHVRYQEAVPRITRDAPQGWICRVSNRAAARLPLFPKPVCPARRGLRNRRICALTPTALYSIARGRAAHPG